MNILVKTVGGGVFSKLMIAIQSILYSEFSGKINDVNDINNIYIDIDRNRICRIRNKNININPFNFALEQNEDLVFDRTILSHPPKHYGGKVYTDVLNHKDLNKLRIICSKIKIKKDILSLVNNNIGISTLGVHVRLTDMNRIHPEYGVSSTKNYIDKINDVIVGGNNKIFVASDNINSLKILKDNFNIISNETTNRNSDEKSGNYMQYLRNRCSDKQLWIDSFLEMISLSKCGELIYKVSNLNNASVIFSNTIKKTYKL